MSHWWVVSLRSTVRLGLLLLFLALGFAQSASAENVGGYRKYSTADDDNNGPPNGNLYRGLSYERQVVNVNTSASDGCVAFFSGSAVFQTSWIIDSDSWVEIGTAHQCGQAWKYDYWGYGQAEPFMFMPLGTSNVASSAATHRYTLTYYYSSASWRFKIDQAQVGAVAAGTTGIVWGDVARVGTESHATNSYVPQHTNSRLREKLQNGWSNWEGKNDEDVDQPLCGQWLSSTKWKVWTSVAPGGTCPAP